MIGIMSRGGTDNTMSGIRTRRYPCEYYYRFFLSLSPVAFLGTKNQQTPVAIKQYRAGGDRVTLAMSRRVLYGLGLGLVALAVGLGFALSALLQQRYENVLDKILLRADAHQLRFDALRHFVHTHSRHAPDAEYRTLVGDAKAITSAIIDYAEGRRAEPPHLICGTRAHLLVDLYRRQGYRARLVFVFDTDQSDMSAHTFADVFNPSTGKWESEDPTYDIHWREISSRNPTSIFDSAEDVGVIEPCGPTKCGWDIVSDEGKSVEDLRDLIDVVSVANDAENIQSTRFTSRAKLDRVLSFHGRTGRFCEIMQGRCDSDEVVRAGAIP
jgi:hypothetical protein